MERILQRLIEEFHERELPHPTPRDREAVTLRGKATTIVGMRRVGKTWFCFQRIRELLDQGLPKERVLYINFEDERLLPFEASDFQLILDTYYRMFPSFKDETCFLFLDEIQRIEGWEMFVRRVLDTENLQVWLTGSSSKLLGSEIATSLRGRSIQTEIFPLTFREFTRFHGLSLGSTPRFGSKTTASLQHLAGRYLEIGGFPEVQFIEDQNIRHQILRNYIDVVILRDVVERYAVSNVTALRALMRHVMSAPSTRFSVNKFYNSLRSRGVRCAKNDLYAFVDYLSDAYLIHAVPLHSRSEKARQVNPKKIYVIDTGLLNAMSFQMTGDQGALLENLVHSQLRSAGLRPEYFLTRSGAEIDFVIPGDGPVLIQSCWSLADEATLERERRALIQAMDELRAKTGTIVTWLGEADAGEGVEVVPIWKWLVARAGSVR